MRDESPLSHLTLRRHVQNPQPPLTPCLTPGSPLLCHVSPHTLTCPSYATAPGHVCTPPVRTLALPLPLLPPRAHVRARPIWHVELNPPPSPSNLPGTPLLHHRSQPAQLRPTIAPPHHCWLTQPRPSNARLRKGALPLGFHQGAVLPLALLCCPVFLAFYNVCYFVCTQNKVYCFGQKLRDQEMDLNAIGLISTESCVNVTTLYYSQG